MKSRSGLTLIELLVVLAIFAVLASLLLPAVQMAREVANRLGCADHLRQMGLACHARHDATGSFPHGYRAGCHPNPLSSSPGWGWAAYLLPYLEQQNLLHRIALHLPIENPVNSARET